jgi:hypothetical protein
VTWSSEQSKLDILQDVRTTFNIVQRDLREAIIIPSSPSNPTGYELKEFTPQKLTFSRYARYQGLKTQDVTYEISIIGKKAKLTRKTSDSLKEEVLLTIKTSEGTRGRVDYGLLAYNPLKPNVKTEFYGLDDSFDPFKYDTFPTDQQKQTYLSKHLTYDKWKTAGIGLRVVVKNLHGSISVFKTLVYPRVKSFSK